LTELPPDTTQRNQRILIKIESKGNGDDASKIDKTSSEANNENTSEANEETKENRKDLGNNPKMTNTGSISNIIEIITEDEQILLSRKNEEKLKAQILCAKRSLITNLFCCLLFIVGHAVVVFLPTDVRIQISVIIFTTVKGAMPILTTISNFGTVQSVIFQYWEYFSK